MSRPLLEFSSDPPVPAAGFAWGIEVSTPTDTMCCAAGATLVKRSGRRERRDGQECSVSARNGLKRGRFFVAEGIRDDRLSEAGRHSPPSLFPCLRGLRPLPVPIVNSGTFTPGFGAPTPKRLRA